MHKYVAYGRGSSPPATEPENSFSAARYNPNKWAKPMKARDIRLAVMNAIG